MNTYDTNTQATQIVIIAPTLRPRVAIGRPRNIQGPGNSARHSNATATIGPNTGAVNLMQRVAPHIIPRTRMRRADACRPTAHTDANNATAASDIATSFFTHGECAL